MADLAFPALQDEGEKEELTRRRAKRPAVRNETTNHHLRCARMLFRATRRDGCCSLAGRSRVRMHTSALVSLAIDLVTQVNLGSLPIRQEHNHKILVALVSGKPVNDTERLRVGLAGCRSHDGYWIIQVRSREEAPQPCFRYNRYSALVTRGSRSAAVRLRLPRH